MLNGFILLCSVRLCCAVCPHWLLVDEEPQCGIINDNDIAILAMLYGCDSITPSLIFMVWVML